MNRFGSRRGSALLIVLGMMAFIIVSAVAFSAYMRFSRMPSSYLRRTSSSRLLVKAALAEAIDRVDRAIGNDPYPGVGGNTYNKWQSRVFTGTNGLAGAGSTVSTLTMEGLAYIPPAFINEVRYYSRRTPTATWQTLNYDAGRYAYCVVDVSDCLDVNRLYADRGRDSSDAGRITLAHCFENASHTGYTIAPSVWENFMEKYSNPNGKGSKIPLVSVADLNLALKANGGFEKMSPFCQYLEQASNAKMVTDNSDGDATVEIQRNLAFVTDSCFARTNAVSTDAIDLSREKDQPFYGMRVMKNDSLTKNDDTLDQLFDSANAKYKKYLDFPRLVQLYDYLDGDSVPLSLAMPTVERTPMVTHIAFNSDLSVSVEKKESQPYPLPKNPNTNLPSGYVKVTTGKLKLSGEFGVKVGCVYPFKYAHGTIPTFKAQVGATVTLVPSGSEQELRRVNAAKPAVLTRNDWSTSKKSATLAQYGSEKTPVVVTMQSEPRNITVKNSIKDETDAVCTDLTFDFDDFNVSLLSDFEAATVPNTIALEDDYKKGTFRLVQTLGEDGTTVKDEKFETTLKPSNAELKGVEEMENKKYVPVVQLWVRIIDANNNTVDLVPAHYRDDEKEAEILADFRSSGERPVLRFYDSSGTVQISNDKTMLDFGEKVVTFEPKGYMADDPRFNHAPECLKTLSDFGGEFKDAWLNAQRSKSRDGDIFMTTSDAGYLQSVFELTALLDITRDDLDSGINGKARATFGDDKNEALAAGGAMWRTWSQCKLGDSDGRDITRAVRFVENGRGFRINPYTDDVNVMLAALANTPLDWWSAGTNDLCAASSEKQKMLDSLKDANKYTFSKHSGALVQVEHGTRKNPTGSITELAQKFMSAFRNGGSDWQDVFDGTDDKHGINWSAEDKIAGVDLGVTLHSVDKKFLHGFWRGCFANRQHLFLVFVRAEPMMMGGGGMGQTPPQLGARAVALVWRDPTPNVKDPSGPHRTRLLFYRQLD